VRACFKRVFSDMLFSHLSMDTKPFACHPITRHDTVEFDVRIGIAWRFHADVPAT
jgi:hypothetical protein